MTPRRFTQTQPTMTPHLRPVLIILLPWFCALCIGCATRLERATLVLEYTDFGPQAMAYHLLGARTQTWEYLGPVHLGQDPVKVVVYRGVRLEEVQRRYPSEAAHGADYRYIEYDEALRYLDARIQQNLLPRITERLLTTRHTIVRNLN